MMKKEENEFIMKPKNESYDEFKEHKLSHLNNTSADRFNGVIDLDESSDEETVVTKWDENIGSKLPDVDAKLKKEEVSLHEEKIIIDNDAKMNDDTDVNLFSNDSNEQFPFNVNDTDFSSDLMDNDSSLGCESGSVSQNEENTDNPDTPQTSDHEKANDEIISSKNVTETPEKTKKDSEKVDNGEVKTSDQIGIEDDRESNCSLDLQLPIEGNETEDASNKPDDAVPNPKALKDHEDIEKEGDDKGMESDSADNKRPSSRESTASTISSSSERTLVVRSMSQLNSMASESEVSVKKEKGTSDTPASEKPTEKPCFSIKNPSQLGVVNSTAGENLLQTGNFVQPADQMMSYLPKMQNGFPCDVCEAQFTERVHLDEHKAAVGHYKCHCSPECATFHFSTLTEFSAHQQTVHGVMNQSPVQQLAHQVQSLPVRYQLDHSGYPPAPTYAASTQPRNVPPLYPTTQNNIQIRQYTNVPGSPRIGGVRSVLPNQNILSKRSATAAQLPRITPAKRRCANAFPNRNGDTDCKVISVQKPDNTDDVVAQLSKSITITARQESQKKNDTVAVANMLANRGITVSSVPAKVNKNNPVQMLNLNSAVSLIPTNATSSNQNRQNSGFAVPQSRLNNTRQPLPGRVSQTVDLTGPDNSRNKSLNRLGKFTCSICDRNFFNQEQLNQHMVIHRSASRKQLPYKCNNCSAQYPSHQGLIQHKQTCRRDSISSHNEMVIPIVDLRQPGALQKLQAVGINHMIPLNALGSQASNGTFGIPILPFSSDRSTLNNVNSIGISNILPVGPLKTLGR